MSNDSVIKVKTDIFVYLVCVLMSANISSELHIIFSFTVLNLLALLNTYVVA